jgi:hypothetical protein
MLPCACVNTRDGAGDGGAAAAAVGRALRRRGPALLLQQVMQQALLLQQVMQQVLLLQPVMQQALLLQPVMQQALLLQQVMQQAVLLQQAVLAWLGGYAGMDQGEASARLMTLMTHMHDSHMQRWTRLVAHICWDMCRGSRMLGHVQRLTYAGTCAEAHICWDMCRGSHMLAHLAGSLGAETLQGLPARQLSRWSASRVSAARAA